MASCTDPNDASKTIQVDQLHYLDGGYRLITRNGAYFDLNPQGNDGLKQFLSAFPALANHDHSTIVRWYRLLGQVAAAYGFYVHPYECFRPDALAPTGFTCRDDYFDSSGTWIMFNISLKFRNNMDYL